jgi:arylsulfatase
MRDYEGFEGTIGRTHGESTPHWPARPRPADGAPNVLVILIDDLGFSHFGCYGSTLTTPNIDALAARGLRFTNFHVTPLCSPTRAALLTGRQAHEVGMRGISNWNTGFPNMRGRISPHAATVAEVLRDNGYTTFALGKWHLAQMVDCSAAGPYDQWPLARGFDRFYGFLDGETDQFQPELTYDNHHVKPPRTPEEGYHLTEDLVDKAVEFLHDTVSIRPDRPWFMYFAPGATHAPHQAPSEYLERHRGRHDEGWDVARERWFARQREMGLLPPSTELAPRNPGVEPWDELSDNQRLLAVRLQEAFAAFLEHTDAQIGRLIAAIEGLGALENTVVFLMSDNGASQEGGPFGVLHEMKFFNMMIETPDEAVARLDDIGGPSSHSNYPWGWAQAGNTPFKWYKQNTHEGGVHVPLVVHWPRGIADAGGLRDQFHHVSDIAPTIYELVGVTPPAVHRGNEQMPITGTSLAYCIGDASAPERKSVQYFENAGHRAIYSDGWKAVTRHVPGTDYDDDVWELYRYREDRSECRDLAAEEPDRLASLVDLWWIEAAEHGVLPLDDRGVQLFAARFDDHSPHRTDRRYVYHPPMTRICSATAAGIGGRSFDIDATIERDADQGGVLYAMGTENAGLSLFVQGGRLVFDYNFFGEHLVVESTAEVPTGSSTVGVRFRRAKKDARATLVIDGAEQGDLYIPRFMRIMSSVGASVGRDEGSPVSDRYRDEFPFEGRLDRVVIRLVEHRADHEAEAAEVAARSEIARQ